MVEARLWRTLYRSQCIELVSPGGRAQTDIDFIVPCLNRRCERSLPSFPIPQLRRDHFAQLATASMATLWDCHRHPEQPGNTTACSALIRLDILVRSECRCAAPDLDLLVSPMINPSRNKPEV